MKKMRQRILAALTALVMAAALLPATVFADDTGGAPVVVTNPDTGSDPGGSTSTGAEPAAGGAPAARSALSVLWVNGVDLLAGGSVEGVSYDPATGTLTLSGAAITAAGPADFPSGIYAEGDLVRSGKF